MPPISADTLQKLKQQKTAWDPPGIMPQNGYSPSFHTFSGKHTLCRPVLETASDTCLTNGNSCSNTPDMVERYFKSLMQKPDPCRIRLFCAMTVTMSRAACCPFLLLFNKGAASPNIRPFALYPQQPQEHGSSQQPIPHPGGTAAVGQKIGRQTKQPQEPEQTGNRPRSRRIQGCRDPQFRNF